MGAIFNLLERHRLESYYNHFLQLGVKDERDFLDSVTEEDLKTLGLSHVEKNRFTAMKSFILRLGAPGRVHTEMPVHKSLQSFCLHYTFPKCPQPRPIKDMDPEQNTVEDLMLRICHLEKVGNVKGVCLYTVDGMPLTDDPFFNTWSLKERHIENESVIYAVFTPKQNLKEAPQTRQRESGDTFGEDVIRCHIMLRGDYELMVNLESDTITSLRLKLASASGIPVHVLHYTDEHNGGDTLRDNGISEGSTVAFSLWTLSDDAPYEETFFINDVVPSVQQSQKGISVFLSSLYLLKSLHSSIVQKKLIAYIRKLTGCNPLAQSLHQLLCRNEMITRNQKIAVVEGLYMLFRELLPQRRSRRGEINISDLDVFENSLFCWAHLISVAEKRSSDHENYAPISLVSEDGHRFCEPVRVPGVPGAFERAYVLQKIRDGVKIPNCSEQILRETSLQKAADIEKMLLSLPPSIKTYPLWIDHYKTTGQNFQISVQETFGGMVEALTLFPRLNVTPPLRLKSLGEDGTHLVLLSEDNLGVYLFKDKGSADMIKVHDCLDGKVKTVDVNVLAAKTGDHRDNHSFVTTRTPREAILVLIDTSSSMEEECYKHAGIKKIDAVKELFYNFASRSMAYDFNHVIGLVKFDTMVKTLHAFTENLEKFKEHIRTLEPNGCTLLYDALRRGALELEKVKGKFPDCRLRIMCLTDGNDSGSSIEPVAVTAKLIKSNIVVDSILLGNEEMKNNMLHGISNATGGCCFKPQTTRDGLKLFEIETVLSLEQRKPKETLDPSSLSECTLEGIFKTRGYDKYPETTLPSQINSRVTATESALKKKIRESKDGRFMEKDKRILEELKSLHCDPHPFFRVFPSESDFTFWRMLMQGPPDTPYEKGVFELYCQFGPEYPVKPPLVRFVTQIYHCNVNSVGRICHNIFDRCYNAHITMRDVFDAVYGLLIVPEPDDPLDSILAEEFLSSRETYEREAKKHTEEMAGRSLDDMEMTLVEPVTQFIPQHLICPLTNKVFVDPVKTVYGTVYERKAIEEHLRLHHFEPQAGPGHDLELSDIIPDCDMKKMAMDYRSRQIQ